MPEPDLLAIVARSLESGLQDLTGRIVNFCTWLKESGPGKIYKAALSQGNLGQICSLLYPAVGLELVNKMVAFNCRVEREVVVGGEWGQGVHKLRDLLRWCKALVGGGGGLQPGHYIGLVYRARLSRREDRLHLEGAYREVFGPEQCGAVRSSAEHPLQVAEVSLHCSRNYVSPAGKGRWR